MAKAPPTPEQLRLLAELRTLNERSEQVQTEAATELATINARRVELVLGLRDGGIGVAQQADRTGVHFTTLYRLLPKGAPPAPDELEPAHDGAPT